MSGTRLSRAMDRVGAMLAPAFTNDDRDLAKETLRACCGATRRVRERNPDGDLIYVDVPDHAVRLAAGVKILEWTVGKPIARSIHAELPDPSRAAASTTGDDLLQLLLAAPDAAADIVSKLQAAAAKAKRSEPINVTPKTQ